MQYLYEQNVFIYSFIGLCGIGLIIRLIIDLVYNKLVKESDNPGASNNKQLKHMKMKFETCYKLKIGVNNVDTFVDKNVLRYRFGGILLSTWEVLSGQALYFSLLLVPISALFGVIFDCEQDLILLTGSVGISASAVLILVDKGLNLPDKKKMIKMNLLDYLENFCKVRLEQEVFHPELLEQYRQEYFKPAAEAALNIPAPSKEKAEPKNELDRRREARRRKDEEKRVLAVKREEEQKKIEELRKEEERRKIEERKRIAAKRREEELLKMEEERLALEAKRKEAKKKEEEKKQAQELKQKQALEAKQQQTEEKEKLLQSVEKELKSPDKKTDIAAVMQGVEEIAAEKEHAEIIPLQKAAEPVQKKRTSNVQEEKLIEDILKEFFA